MLANDWSQRRSDYDILVIGSGYGGAITAARLAGADLDPKPSVCILERGREWPIGTFPDRLGEILEERRFFANPLGLYEFLTYRDISVIKGSGLGGTSLVNANVAIVPDREAFELTGWPASLNLEVLHPYYKRAHQVLDAKPHPRGTELPKVQGLQRRAEELGIDAVPLDIAVNFSIDGPNLHGVEQRPCIDCGDCVTGCNVGAKNTLYMNYLPMAKNAGAEIYTQAQVDWIERLADGRWRVHGRRYRDKITSDSFSIPAANVILAAGAINTSEILLRSETRGLSLSPRVGTGLAATEISSAWPIMAITKLRCSVLAIARVHPVRSSLQGPQL